MSDGLDFLHGQDAALIGSLLLRTGIVAGMPHGELAKHLGVSRRTVSRWSSEGTRLHRDKLVVVAQIALDHDPSLAAEIAAAAGETLVSLGLEAPSPPEATRPIAAAPVAPPIAKVRPHPKLADAVVCAAAESIDVSPRLARRALLAAIQAAREVGMTMDEIEQALG
jgi:hypothetical protein